MKYPEIASILGWTETPDLQEGIHLQPEEAAKIHEHLVANKTAIQQAVEDGNTALTAITGELTTATGRVTALEGELATSKDSLSTATTQLSAVNGQLTTAQARIAELEAMDGRVSTTVTDEDPKQGGNKDISKYMTSFDTMFSIKP